MIRVVYRPSIDDAAKAKIEILTIFAPVPWALYILWSDNVVSNCRAFVGLGTQAENLPYRKHHTRIPMVFAYSLFIQTVRMRVQ